MPRSKPISLILLLLKKINVTAVHIALAIISAAQWWHKLCGCNWDVPLPNLVTGGGVY